MRPPKRTSVYYPREFRLIWTQPCHKCHNSCFDWMLLGVIERECGTVVLGVPRLIQGICYNEYKELESWRRLDRKEKESCGVQIYFRVQNNHFYMLFVSISRESFVRPLCYPVVYVPDVALHSRLLLRNSMTKQFYNNQIFQIQ